MDPGFRRDDGQSGHACPVRPFYPAVSLYGWVRLTSAAPIVSQKSRG